MNLLFARTDKGQNALTDKYVQLPHSLMRALIIVDGNRRVGELHEMAPLYDDLEESLETLVNEQFIQEKAALPAKNATAEVKAEPIKPALLKSVEKVSVAPKIDVKQRLISLLKVELGARDDKQITVSMEKMIANISSANEQFDELSAAWKKCIKITRMTIDEELAGLMRESGERILEKLKG